MTAAASLPSIETRLATIDDLDELCILGGKLFDQTPWARATTFDASSFGHTLTHLIGLRSLLVADDGGGPVGMLAFLVAPIYVNLAQTFAQELFLIAGRPGAGREMVRTLIDTARDRGAVLVITTAQVGLRDDAVARMYRSLGFTETERSFIRKL